MDMKMKHLLLEVYCDCKDETKPLYCTHGIGWPGSHCFENNCKYLSYTNCPNEIAYAGTTGVVEKIEHFIGFGGDMYPENCDEESERFLIQKWQEICEEKIAEAYKQFKSKY